jgi:aminobenzoyl-glutamate utilization protein B
MVHVAKVMAGTAVDALRNPGIVAAAKAEHAAKMAVTPYVCPLAPDVKPALGMSLAE